MRLNTIVTLGASAAFGLMAVFLARGWINGAVENEFRQAKGPSVKSISVRTNTTPVLIADLDMSLGDVLSRDAVRFVNYPDDAVPFGAFTDIEALFDGQGQRIVLTSLAYNEPILEQKITGPNGRASLSARIRPGYRAVTVRVDDVSGVAGFVVPGDIVDIIYTREPEVTANKRAASKSAATAYISDIILQNVTVLGVDQNQAEMSSAANVARTVTLEVTNEEGQALSLAMEYGVLSLSLRGVGETLPSAVRQLKLSDVGARKTRSTKRKSKPRAVAKTVKTAPSNIAEITVIRGGPDSEETVEHLSVKMEKTRSGQGVSNATNSAATLHTEMAGG